MYSIFLLIYSVIAIPSVVGWSPVPQQHQQTFSINRHASCDCDIQRNTGGYTHLLAFRKPDIESTSTGRNSNMVKSIRSIVTATTALTIGWWSSSIIASYLPQAYDNHHNPIIINVASAKEMASGSGSRVNKDPESLLRYGLPIQNKEVRMNN